ncbi:hypothetical protein DAMA08_001040 [Martiniozyma asiatica (nom. inval.)]|nr:hypothetical protein DAMA08_001040 [Martiniozyma asiatica]
MNKNLLRFKENNSDDSELDFEEFNELKLFSRLKNDRPRQNPLSSTEFSKFKKIEKIGFGGCSKVWKVKNFESGKVYALKQINLKEKSDFNKEEQDEDIRQLLQEVNIMQDLMHKNIIKIHGYYLNWTNKKLELFTDFVGQQQLCILLEHSPNGSLLSFIESHGNKLSTMETSSITRQILTGLNYLDDKGIVHCDIKSSNILIFSKGLIKICDFGSSFIIDNKAKHQLKQTLKEFSSYWLAPELIHHYSPSHKSDIWALGCTIYEMMTGKPPLYNENSLSVIHTIGKLFKKSPSDIIKKFSTTNLTDKLCITFLQSCLNPNKDKRPNAKKLLQYEWITKVNDLEVKFGKSVLEYVDINSYDDWSNISIPLPKQTTPQSLTSSLFSSTGNTVSTSKSTSIFLPTSKSTSASSVAKESLRSEKSKALLRNFQDKESIEDGFEFTSTGDSFTIEEDQEEVDQFKTISNLLNATINDLQLLYDYILKSRKPLNNLLFFSNLREAIIPTLISKLEIDSKNKADDDNNNQFNLLLAIANSCFIYSPYLIEQFAMSGYLPLLLRRPKNTEIKKFIGLLWRLDDNKGMEWYHVCGGHLFN